LTVLLLNLVVAQPLAAPVKVAPVRERCFRRAVGSMMIRRVLMCL
jgi:hypothetical protein